MMRSALTSLAGWFGPLIVRAWFSTIRLRWHGGAYLHPDPRTRGTCIYVFWHQRLLCFTYTHGRYHGRILVSRSRDGEVIARVAAGLGFVPVRGSSRRHGAEAVRTLLAEVKTGCDIGITPDGPKGPRHVFQTGAVYVASRSGLPLVPLTVSYKRCWRFKSWDGFLLPWPFTWGVIRAGEAVTVPPDLDAAGIEEWRARLETILREHTETTDAHAKEYYVSGRTFHDL